MKSIATNKSNLSSSLRSSKNTIFNLAFKNFSKNMSSSKPNYRFLISGSGGQIGKALIPRMIEKYGRENVIYSDISWRQNPVEGGIFERLDVTDHATYQYLVEKYKINYIVHLSGILSATGKKDPQLAIKVNVNGVINALNLAKDYNAKIFIPSTIAVFGPDVQKKEVPNKVPLQPTTIYGVTKVFMENIGNYYNHKFNVDFRSIRYPGVIAPYEYESHGTTDYASEIYFAAAKGRDYSICLSKDVVLPFAFLDDCIHGTMQLIEADNSKLTARTYNMQGLSFSCEECANEVKRIFPNFRFEYKPDFRDLIAKNWPQHLDDSLARRDWGWDPKCKDLKSLSEEMLKTIKK